MSLNNQKFIMDAFFVSLLLKQLNAKLNSQAEIGSQLVKGLSKHGNM